MALIREDRHGLYIKAGGYIFRPVFPIGYNHVHKDGSEYSKGDKVYAVHRAGGPLAKVGVEVWFSHGAYFPQSQPKNSESHYKPPYESWKS